MKIGGIFHAYRKHVTNFVVNKVPTKAILNKMKEQGLINDDEIYIVEDDDSSSTFVSYETQTLTDAQKTQARTNIGALSNTGNAASATKLATARTIRTNLSSTSAASFNGTSNIDPGVSGTLGIDHGGTGATTAAGARTNLGAFSTDGGTLTGNVTIKKDSNPFFKLQLGNNSTTGIVQVYLPSGSSTQKMAVGFGSSKSIVVDDDGCLILTDAMYGTTLPAAGKKGRIFFKKV